MLKRSTRARFAIVGALAALSSLSFAYESPFAAEDCALMLDYVPNPLSGGRVVMSASFLQQAYRLYDLSITVTNENDERAVAYENSEGPLLSSVTRSYMLSDVAYQPDWRGDLTFKLEVLDHDRIDPLSGRRAVVCSQVSILTTPRVD